MIAMINTAMCLRKMSEELGGVQCERLITPRNNFPIDSSESFAIDNGAFKGFVAEPFVRLLKREWNNRSRCRFVVVPDVVGDAKRTLELFEEWAPQMTGWPLALAAQDGVENLEIPWDKISTLFIGGTNEWKMCEPAISCMREAKARGKWIHVGRVSTIFRWRFYEKRGADSVDGSALAKFRNRRLQLGQQLKEVVA